MRRINPTALALGGLALLLLLLWYFSSNRSADQDKLTGNETAQTAPASAERRCSSKATYDLIKRDLFRRAAQLRGSDQAAFDRLAAYAVVRMENPVMESEDKDTGTVNCSGSLFLDLPPGVAVVGGRRSLAGNVEYSLQAAADDSGQVVLLRNIDAIVAPLATLARVAQPTPTPAPADGNPMIPPTEPGVMLDPTAPGQIEPVEPAAPAPPRPVGARPSFDCGNASTRGEIAVCRDAGLAQLDRQMSAQFFRALDRADPGQRAILQRTRGSFLSFRDNCRTNGCIADAYRGRMREISDIMAGRWQPR